MKNYYFLFLSLLLFWGCQKSSVDIESEYQKIKDNQTKFILNIDNKPFYETDAIFTGHLEAKNNYFVMNFVNQHGGNYILSLSDDMWFNKKGITGKLYGAAISNLMLGKVIDREKNIGAGYLMSEGIIEPITVSKSKLIFKINGKLKKYPNVSETDPSFAVNGYIISKNPEYSEYTIPNK